MPETKTIREQVVSLLQARPFQRFVMVLESGNRVPVEHPENFGYDRNPKYDNFTVLTWGISVWGSFTRVSAIVQADRGGDARR